MEGIGERGEGEGGGREWVHKYIHMIVHTKNTKMGIQWIPSIPVGTRNNVLIRGVSSFQGQNAHN